MHFRSLSPETRVTFAYNPPVGRAPHGVHQGYPTALVATTERPRTEQWMALKGRERSMTY
eukprot:4703159-Prymnesium_polylepis.1